MLILLEEIGISDGFFCLDDSIIVVKHETAVSCHGTHLRRYYNKIGRARQPEIACCDIRTNVL